MSQSSVKVSEVHWPPRPAADENGLVVLGSSSTAQRLSALSPLDGRYAGKVEGFAAAFSESALMRYRFQVEVAWLCHLASLPELVELGPLSDEDRDALKSWVDQFGPEDAEKIKAIEARTNHDVKAVEYELKARLVERGWAPERTEFVHFGATSEDINNLAYALMVRHGLFDAWLPLARDLVEDVEALALRNAGQPMLSRTHGQPATPTTLGKELAVFSSRWRRQLRQITGVEMLGKWGGATGTLSAHVVAYPEVRWIEVSKAFVESMGLTWNPLTTQIEPHDWMAELFHALSRFDCVLIDFCRDMWSYISLGHLRQAAVPGEVGSSTMPHKVNPIDFENAEANAGVANAMLEHLASKLAVSRMQRDLSDSSALRNVGSAMAYSGLALSAARKGLSRVAPDGETIAADLSANWEVLAEAIQTVMRRYGVSEPYERLKELTRGKRIGQEEIAAFVRTLGLPDQAEVALLELVPSTYVGVAAELVERFAPAPKS